MMRPLQIHEPSTSCSGPHLTLGLEERLGPDAGDTIGTGVPDLNRDSEWVPALQR